MTEEIMFMLVEQQAQQETDMTRCEREVQAQMTTVQQHMKSLLQVVNESTATAKLPHCTLDAKTGTTLRDTIFIRSEVQK